MCQKCKQLLLEFQTILEIINDEVPFIAELRRNLLLQQIILIIYWENGYCERSHNGMKDIIIRILQANCNKLKRSTIIKF